jgi:serine/threonine-protein kinase RsbW
MADEQDARELLLPVGPQAPGLARRVVAGWFGERLEAARLDDVQLVVSELITNSCVHAEPAADRSVRLKAAVAGGVVRLEVRDGGTDGAVARRTPDAEGGYGLNIVQQLATRWGIDHSDGTVVWCELRTGA